MKHPLSLTVLGGAREIGANSFYLDLGSSGLLLDAGLHPRRQGIEAIPDFGRVQGNLDNILVSHAHLDHVGSLPVALRRFPRARVFMTEATSLLAVRMLRNAVNVARHHQGGRRGGEALYSHEDVEWVEQVAGTRVLEQTFELDIPSRHKPRVTFHGAGHLLGAAGILVEIHGRRLFYTGDTCETAQYLCGPARYPAGPIHLLLLDSTHGADEGPDLGRDRRSFRRAISALGEFITRVAARGGSVLIPVFALGRSQEILAVLSSLLQRGRIPRLPIFITGLAHAVCRIYDAVRGSSARRHPRLRLEDAGARVLRPDLLADPDLLRSPCILAASSGMMFEGTTSHALACRMAGDPRHGIAFVGYLDPESPGHRLARASRGQVLDIGGATGRVEAACEIESFGFTAHSRASQLLHTVEIMRPSQVVLVHGEPDAVEGLRRRLELLPSRVIVAEPGASIPF